VLGFEVAGAVVVALAIAGAIVWRRRSPAAPQNVAPPSQVPPRVTSGEVRIVHSTTGTVEGLEICYGPDALVRSVRVGAMNSEHKELLMTMDEVRWRALPNAQKQEVLAAARSTWAQRMCADGPDIAYVVMKTEAGQIVGRADPHHVTVL
jgi:hypothetical protein